jgi:hypothetical protein
MFRCCSTGIVKHWKGLKEFLSKVVVSESTVHVRVKTCVHYGTSISQLHAFKLLFMTQHYQKQRTPSSEYIQSTRFHGYVELYTRNRRSKYNETADNDTDFA